MAKTIKKAEESHHENKTEQEMEIKTDEYGFEIFEEDEEMNEPLPEEESEELFEDEEETQETQETGENKSIAVDTTKKKDNPFDKIIKAYLDELAETDEELKKTYVSSEDAIKKCREHIIKAVKDNKDVCNGSFGVLDDKTGYNMMREYFVDGLYSLDIAEEEKRKKESEERAKKAEEEKKKRQAEEEEKKKWEEYCQNPQQSDLDEDRKNQMRLKFATEQSLFDFD